MSARLVLLRHGETEWSLSGQHTGITDLPLTPAGETRARRLGAVWASRPVSEIFTSPLRRARDTAALAGLTPSTVLDELSEWDYGGYEGLTTPQIRDRTHPAWTIWEDGAVPGLTPGETAVEVGRRADQVLDRVRPLLDEAEGAVVLVAHGHVLRVLAARWIDLDPAAGRRFALDAGCYSVLAHEHARPVIERWNVQPLGDPGAGGDPGLE